VAVRIHIIHTLPVVIPSLPLLIPPPLIQNKTRARTRTRRLMVRQAASLLDAKDPSATTACAMAKRVATDLGFQVRSVLGIGWTVGGACGGSWVPGTFFLTIVTGFACCGGWWVLTHLLLIAITKYQVINDALQLHGGYGYLKVRESHETTYQRPHHHHHHHHHTHACTSIPLILLTYSRKSFTHLPTTHPPPNSSFCVSCKALNQSLEQPPPPSPPPKSLALSVLHRTTTSSATCGTRACTRFWRAPTRSCASSSRAPSSRGRSRSMNGGPMRVVVRGVCACMVSFPQGTDSGMDVNMRAEGGGWGVP
jgi:hypothetical protein